MILFVEILNKRCFFYSSVYYVLSSTFELTGFNNIAAHPDKYESWHFTYTWKTLTRPIHIKKKGLGLYNWFNPATFYWSHESHRSCARDINL